MTGADGLSTLTSLTPSPVTVSRAGEAARAAAECAGVVIRCLTAHAELVAVEQLFAGIWRRDTSPPVSVELVRALAKAGNYVSGAFDGEDLVGGCVGFFAAPAEGAMHSHIAGVSSSTRNRHVGYAMKLHQRAWALEHGVSVISWTFDPLVSRNAHFNITKLAAEPVEYLPNFYGAMTDAINGGDDSDRVLVRWMLDRPEVTAVLAGRRTPVDAAVERSRGAVVALGSSPDGAPVLGALDAPRSLVAVPSDIEGMRLAQPGLARQWRVAVRQALHSQLADGARVTGFDRAGWYVLQRAGAEQSPTKGATP